MGYIRVVQGIIILVLSHVFVWIWIALLYVQVEVVISHVGVPDGVFELGVELVIVNVVHGDTSVIRVVPSVFAELDVLSVPARLTELNWDTEVLGLVGHFAV